MTRIERVVLRHRIDAAVRERIGRPSRPNSSKSKPGDWMPQCRTRRRPTVHMHGMDEWE